MQQAPSTLSLEERTELGTRAVRKLRAQGGVPAVVYGHNTESQAAQGLYHDVTKVYLHAGKHSPVELSFKGKKRLAMVKRVDIDPIKHQLLHIAFYVVRQNEKVQTEVQVKIEGEGETPAEKAGLVLIKNVDAIQIEAFPRNLPELLTVSGEKLAEAGDVLTVADIVAPEGVTILSEAAQQIASAVEPAALVAANEAEEEAQEEETAEGEEGENDASEEGASSADEKKTEEDKE